MKVINKFITNLFECNKWPGKSRLQRITTAPVHYGFTQCTAAATDGSRHFVFVICHASVSLKWRNNFNLIGFLLLSIVGKDLLTLFD